VNLTRKEQAYNTQKFSFSLMYFAKTLARVVSITLGTYCVWLIANKHKKNTIMKTSGNAFFKASQKAIIGAKHAAGF